MQPSSHGHSGAVMLRAVMLTAALLQQSPARALWCCGAPWAPAWIGVTAMLTVPGPRSAAPLAAATSANCPPRVKALCHGAETVPRSPIPSLAEHPLCRASVPLPWSTVPLWGPMGAWGGGSSQGQGFTTPFPLSARAQCARGSVLPPPPGLVSASSYAWRTRTVHPARSAACRTAAAHAFPHCRVRPTPHPVCKGQDRDTMGHSSCSDHHIYLFQAQPSPAMGVALGPAILGPFHSTAIAAPTAPLLPSLWQHFWLGGQAMFDPLWLKSLPPPPPTAVLQGQRQTPTSTLLHEPACAWHGHPQSAWKCGPRINQHVAVGLP